MDTATLTRTPLEPNLADLKLFHLKVRVLFKRQLLKSVQFLLPLMRAITAFNFTNLVSTMKGTVHKHFLTMVLLLLDMELKMAKTTTWLKIPGASLGVKMATLR